MLSKADALTTANGILEASRNEDTRLAKVDTYTRGTYAPKAYIPRKPSNRSAHAEYLAILQRSRMPVLSLVVDALAQNLFVDGYRPPRSADNAAGWESWQVNRMDARQSPLHRAAIGYGVSYLTILPGDSAPVWRPVSPRRGRAMYADRVNDEWPVYFLEEWTEGVTGGAARRRFRLYDSQSVYELAGGELSASDALMNERRWGVTGTEGAVDLLSVSEHDAEVCPVVRFVGDMDLDGAVVGEVEPLIPLQDQLDASTFYVEMAQQYAVHRQRWVTGMAIPEDDNGDPKEPFNVAIDRMLVAEDPDTKFGEFEQTDIQSWLDAREATLRAISIKSQTPPGYMLGKMSNLSAEALAATEAPAQRRAGTYRTSFGESHEQAFRLDARLRGDEAGWGATAAQVVWRDTESRSLAQVADALGKMAASLGIPPRGLWEKIPGVTDQDLATWEQMRTGEQERAAELAARSFGVEVAQSAEVT